MEFFKHYSQLNARELEVINTAIRSTNNYRISKHCKQRIKQRGIEVTEVYKTIQIGKVIEYHYVDNSNRVLLRRKQPFKNRFICVVIDLKTHDVITVYPTNEDITLKVICSMTSINILKYIN